MLPKGPYNPNENDKEMLNFWLENKFYKPEYDPVKNVVQSLEEMKNDPRTPFSLICPPPNAYARPHMGNISGYAYQDAMGRYARMHGKKVLLIPGKDHAGLEGEGVFVRDVLEPKKIDKFSLSREEFYKMIWEFFQDNMEVALKDEMNIGLSADFDRNIFTLDPKIVQIVLNTFIEMYKDGMIYKGVRIINWDTKAKSTLADNQCIREEREGIIYTLKYKLADGAGEITVATTRPETMFGDTAIAVNPKDKRYKDLVGKTVLIPLTNKEIPIITDPNVDMEFGTGALKITPAHALDDFKIMQNWNAAHPDQSIGYANVIDQDSRLVGPVPEKFKGKKYKEVLPELIEDLKKENLFVKSDSLKQNILIAERTRAIVEPMMSSQWFVDVEKFKQPVIDMVKSGKVKLHPKNMEAKFYHWMDNLRDWAISRTLWWGYRMPVWYSGPITEKIDANGKVETFILVNGVEEVLDPKNQKHMLVQTESPGEGWIQEDAVLDTWFSSGQWPFATLTTFDLMDTFYPTDVMETSHDILENWVSRMMMFSWFKLKQIPFKDVYLHGLVLGTDGQKMSKSRGNILPVDDAVNNYGTDALRLCYFYQNSAGASYAITLDKLMNFKNFCNKIWNASRFTLMNLEGLTDTNVYALAEADLKYESNIKLFKHIKEIKEKITENIDKFQFGLATGNLYDSFWKTFCDICLEEAKPHVYTFKDKETGAIKSEPKPEEKLETQKVLLLAIKEYMKMMHPFIPFITERIWQELPKEEGDHKSLMYTKW